MLRGFSRRPSRYDRGCALRHFRLNSIGLKGITAAHFRDVTHMGESSVQLLSADLSARAAAPAPAKKSGLPSHSPALDGIRGLAVLLIFYCHTTLIDPGGALGKLFVSSSR